MIDTLKILQGNHSVYTKVGATCKHYAAYSLEQWEGISRFTFDAQLDPRWACCWTCCCYCVFEAANNSGLR